jgi:hypothetical protein
MTDFSLRQIIEIGGCREQKIDEWGRQCSSVTGGRLSEAQFDHLRIATGVDDTGVFKGLLILVIKPPRHRTGLTTDPGDFERPQDCTNASHASFQFASTCENENLPEGARLLCPHPSTSTRWSSCEICQIPPSDQSLRLSAVRMTTLTSFAIRRVRCLCRGSQAGQARRFHAVLQVVKPQPGHRCRHCVLHRRHAPCLRTLIENDKVGRVGLATDPCRSRMSTPDSSLRHSTRRFAAPLARLAVAGSASGP